MAGSGGRGGADPWSERALTNWSPDLNRGRAVLRPNGKTMTETYDDHDQTPTMTEEEAREEGKELLEGSLRVALVSIVALSLAAAGLLQATDLVDLFPFGGDWTYEWVVFVLLAVAIVAAEAWTWREGGADGRGLAAWIVRNSIGAPLPRADTTRRWPVPHLDLRSRYSGRTPWRRRCTPSARRSPWSSS